MNRKYLTAMGAAALLLNAGLAPAQSDNGAPSEQGMPDDHPFSLAYMDKHRFSKAPKIGEPLPDVTVFNEGGDPINLREMAQGHYTVLVLGCLT